MNRAKQEGEKAPNGRKRRRQGRKNRAQKELKGQTRNDKGGRGVVGACQKCKRREQGETLVQTRKICDAAQHTTGIGKTKVWTWHNGGKKETTYTTNTCSTKEGIAKYEKRAQNKENTRTTEKA